MARTYRHQSLNDYLALVNAEDWEAVCAGDQGAKARIADALDGVDLYYHAGPHLPGKAEDYIAVTVADLLSHGIIKRVTLHKEG